MLLPSMDFPLVLRELNFLGCLDQTVRGRLRRSMFFVKSLAEEDIEQRIKAAILEREAEKMGLKIKFIYQARKAETTPEKIKALQEAMEKLQ